MKKIYILCSVFLTSLSIKAQETAFFVHAHQDDAVYFCGVPLFDKVSSGVKTVAILTSASDQGAHDGIYTADTGIDITTPFYQARDYGYKKALEYCYTNDNLPLNFSETTVEVTFAGKKVRKWTYGNNITMYFLDLPNGNCCSLNMDGYPANNGQSIEKLRKGTIETITNVTNTSTYTWTELKNTIKAIFETEKGSISTVYSTDVDLSKNPGDHADHYITSVLALQAMDGLPGFSSKLHTDYELSNKNPNLTETEKIKKISTFGAMISGIGTKGYRANRHLSYTNWFISEYIRDANIHNELINLSNELGGNPYNKPNIALNKPSSVSGSEAGHDGSKANDGDVYTYWGNTPYTQSWQVDLQNKYNVEDIQVINYFQDSRYYKYKVYASTDNINWIVVADNSKNTDLSTNKGKTFNFSNPVQARYFKIEMLYNSVNQGVHIAEFIAHGDLVPETRTNIALNKPTTVSGSELGTEEPKANDGNLNTYWGNTPYTQFWQVDLQNSYNVDEIKVVNYFGDTRSYKYKVYASTDNVNWTMVADYSSNTSLSNSAGTSFPFSKPVQARYFKVDMLYNSVNQGVHIAEFMAYGTISSASNRISSDEKGGLFFIKNPIKKGDKLDLNNTRNINEVSLFDLNGKKILTKLNLKENETIDTSNLPSGNYILKLDYKTERLIIE
ncbi:discoidin domain-containing protein [Flavobacterium oreochromis]|uniref:F5/8 type C domain-containing protein n=1 Tax=Flavobacterium columnare TaxID=996 RepID=A0A246GBN4_9FLAO|nr:discoidin domain-containing protein [Flavobacterium oreochromis]OWP78136.1 hypothetical protein BWK62_05910 [Flavobacterium oreochromis]